MKSTEPFIVKEKEGGKVVIHFVHPYINEQGNLSVGIYITPKSNLSKNIFNSDVQSYVLMFPLAKIVGTVMTGVYLSKLIAPLKSVRREIDRIVMGVCF